MDLRKVSKDTAPRSTTAVSDLKTCVFINSLLFLYQYDEVGHIPGRRESLPTPVFWPGEFRALDSLWGCKESDTTE